MKKRKIIACLDIDNRRVVKGKKFQDVQELADPVVLAKKYEAEGADELVFYDISASLTGRGMFLDLIREIADQIEIPFVVGGGIQTLSDVELAIEAGADKVSINSGALKNPTLLTEASQRYGSSRIIVSIDVSRTENDKWTVFAKAGQQATDLDAEEWAKQCEQLGAGEIVLNCIDQDGMRNGYDLELTNRIVRAVSIPVVASGGAGSEKHIQELFEATDAAGALVASVLHFNLVTLNDLLAAATPQKVQVTFDEKGLIPTIVQDVTTGDVLMLAYMNEESLQKTIETNETWFYSRSRGELWNKGATSGNRQIVQQIDVDCDQDTLLIQVVAKGPACHTGTKTCFTRSLPGDVRSKRTIVQDVAQQIQNRKHNPVEGSYTTYLFQEGIDKILKKVGEESTEVVIGAKNNDLVETANELADLTYHTLVLMEELGVSVEDVKSVLESRRM